MIRDRAGRDLARDAYRTQLRLHGLSEEDARLLTRTAFEVWRLLWPWRLLPARAQLTAFGLLGRRRVAALARKLSAPDQG